MYTFIVGGSIIYQGPLTDLQNVIAYFLNTHYQQHTLREKFPDIKQYNEINEAWRAIYAEFHCALSTPKAFESHQFVQGLGYTLCENVVRSIPISLSYIPVDGILPISHCLPEYAAAQTAATHPPLFVAAHEAQIWSTWKSESGSDVVAHTTLRTATLLDIIQCSAIPVEASAKLAAEGSVVDTWFYRDEKTRIIVTRLEEPRLASFYAGYSVTFQLYSLVDLSLRFADSVSTISLGDLPSAVATAMARPELSAILHQWFYSQEFTDSIINDSVWSHPLIDVRLVRTEPDHCVHVEQITGTKGIQC